MGVTYSHSSGQDDDTANHLGILRLSYVDADNLVNTYFKHQFQPTMKADSLQRLFYAAYGPRLELEMTATLDSCKQIFKDSSSTIYTQEVLATIALLANASWHQRTKLLFNVFKCIGSEDMGHEDFMLAAQVVATALCRLWQAPMWDSASIRILSEVIADNAFTKLERDLDETVDQEKFVQWSVDRFREGKTVATSEALKALYTSPL